MKVQHTFNGTGATVYLCLGFIPDYVRIISGGDPDVAQIEWFRNSACAEIARGLHFVGSSGAVQQDARTVANGGVAIYDGGDLLSATNQTSTTYGEGVYLGQDYRNMAVSSSDAINPGQGDGANILRWTLDNSGNKTGHFDAPFLTPTVAVVGIGSRIKIRPSRYAAFPEYDAMITAVSNNGDAANDITLDRAVPSGEVGRLTGRFTLSPLAIGSVTAPGVVVEMTSVLNVNNETQVVIAEKF